MKYDYEKYLPGKREENIEIVKKESSQDWVKEKINNFCERFLRFKPDDIQRRVAEDDFVAAYFGKDPSVKSRQFCA